MGSRLTRAGNEIHSDGAVAAGHRALSSLIFHATRLHPTRKMFGGMRAERRSGFRCGSSGDVATAYGDVDSAMISQRDDRESLTCKRLCDSMGNSKRSVVGCHVRYSL